jgi:hypothetical protein
METKKLLSFIHKLPVHIPPVKLSELSKTLLNRIIHQINLGRKEWKKERTYREEVLKEFPKGVDFQYIVEDIQEQIETFSKIGKKYSFMIGPRTFTIYVIYPYSSRISVKKIYSILNECVLKMYLWLYTASHFAPVGCSRELVIYWYLTEHKKELPKGSQTKIDRVHANTAFTMACPKETNNIYIFRKEEWFKVFIHETFHSLGLDFATLPDEYAKKAMFSIFPVSCDLRFYEAYTEVWAEIINVLFISLENGGNTISQMETYLLDEQIFSLFQNVKILNQQKIRYRELNTSRGKKYNEKTSAFSYYILKSIFIFFCNDFIEWCAMKNKGTIAFKKTPQNIIELVNFVRTKYQDPEYVKAIEELERWFSQTKYKGFEMDTLRMTIYA